MDVNIGQSSQVVQKVTNSIKQPSVNEVSSSTPKVVEIPYLESGNVQLKNDILRYDGWQYQEGASTDITLLDKDLNNLDRSDPLSARFMEIGGVKGVDSEDQAQFYSQQVMEGKLDPKNGITLLQAGDEKLNLNMEYGVASFDGGVMYQRENDYGNSSENNHYATNKFSANVNVVTKSGNSISLSLTYKEEIDLIDTGAMDPFETHEEYNERWLRESMAPPQSKSDYRSLVVSYTSGEPLSDEDSKHLNQITSYLMNAADSAQHGNLRSNEKLEQQFNNVKDQFQSINVDASYEGYAQSDVDISLKIMNGTIDSKIEFEDAPSDDPFSSKKEVMRFWD